MNRSILFLLLLSTACGKTNFSGSTITEPEHAKIQNKDADGTVAVVEQKSKSRNVESAEQIILDQCASGVSQETITQTIVFPESIECAFGKSGNLPERDQHFQARIEQVQMLTIPPDHVICDMAINSKTTDLHYDDFFVLTIEDNILVSTNETLTPGPRRDARNKIHKWDFEAIKGQPWGDDRKYCFGGNSSCKIPSHDRQGAVAIDIPKNDFLSLAVELFELKQIEMKMVTLGDNDEGDCEHSRLELDLEMTIAPARFGK
ncbi:MAG: hypothetical protein AB8G05_21690 [Oligoflexales bacterium]